MGETLRDGIASPASGGASSPPFPNGKSASGPATPEGALAAWAPDEGFVRQVITLDGGKQLAAAVQARPESVRVRMVCNAGSPLILHWGIAWQFRHEWQLPPETDRPAGTSLFDGKAARTPFVQRDGLEFLELEFHKPADRPGALGMPFVLHRTDHNAWLKSGGKEMFLSLFERATDPRLTSARERDLAEQIVGVEKGAQSWTLMHRFNLCHDLSGAAQHDADALALLFAWLRYSAIRQLDWQRRYNTQPRDLSHAQNRLTMRLAGLYRTQTNERFWLRLMLTTLGRGGEGQKVRDEILHIMHRNHLKEVSGTFVEEWHQKLHNNTTPDDVVICQAYLAFLRSNGNQKSFTEALEAGGVTRERLRSFERPIKTDPVFFGDRKDALIRDFENFLRVLKSVHAGADLESAAAAARGRLSDGLKQKVDGVLGSRSSNKPLKEQAAGVLSAREELAGAMAGEKNDGVLRDLLFLDLALEEAWRGMIERQNLSQFNCDALVELVHAAMRNVILSINARELGVCAGHWGALLAGSRDGRDWALHAKSVTDRAARWVAECTSDLYQRLQPKAEFLGQAFGVEAWTIPLFSEEVIRGGPVFPLALLLRHLDPLLRKAAGLGGWQVISPAAAAGKVRVVDRLLAVQGERFGEATVLIADAVSGNEEIPEGVTAVLTSDSPDLVSHLAVRARNARVLFATCYEPAVYNQLKTLADRNIVLGVTPGGDVEQQESDVRDPESGVRSPESGVRSPAPEVRSPAPWVIAQDQFSPAWVGGKSNNLNGLRGRLPEWISLPASIALPFGTLDRTLETPANRDIRLQREALVKGVEQDPAGTPGKLRTLLMHLAPPDELKSSLLEVWQRVGLPPTPWEPTWSAVKRVWASMWNDRAYLSRRGRGVPHDSLQMAVLIQQVIPADYAFVIHTINPLTGNRTELFAEVVLGMGETLVGNYPGRALGFVCTKSDLKIHILSYPGKSVGLYGKGVIFRSDSNGEDLEGFAGAGLYDSFLAEEPERRLLDYRNENLLWNSTFREEMLRSIARLGIEVERVLGSPQDIEGVVMRAGGDMRYHVVQTRPQVGLDSGKKDAVDG